MIIILLDDPYLCAWNEKPTRNPQEEFSKSYHGDHDDDNDDDDDDNDTDNDDDENDVAVTVTASLVLFNFCLTRRPNRGESRSLILLFLVMSIIIIIIVIILIIIMMSRWKGWRSRMPDCQSSCRYKYLKYLQLDIFEHSNICPATGRNI